MTETAPSRHDTLSSLRSLAKLDLFAEIERLKKEMNAVILAHYYQEPDIQDVADLLGDSLQLAQAAQKTNADVIVFAGVHFMAETAKILNPDKQVLLPDLNAGCSLADSCPPALFAKFKEQHTDAVVVSYINCSAEIKAMSDIICTSSNAEKIIRSIPEHKKIIFAPDKNLGAYLVKKLNRPMILWQGTCFVHESFSERQLIRLKTAYPNAKVIAHPECEESILRHADFIGSTRALLDYTIKSPDDTYLVVTETGIIHEMKKRSPHKNFIAALYEEKKGCACNECPYMKLNTLEKLYLCMKNRSPEITMPEELRLRALKPLERMLEISA
ncbi:MAG: quinolinate synthase NadA [Chloroherpetonaceae bacterium]|nr:quinolinate synthase NadA [Chloroherpetonaceae bacterium]MCS7211738.1 quinolinate synthase NadA [Chloroherpetonaceae bacterium]MDW8019193.1 quinolinate synthase NadA [Chloroherpetonaceae bacterium]